MLQQGTHDDVVLYDREGSDSEMDVVRAKFYGIFPR